MMKSQGLWIGFLIGLASVMLAGPPLEFSLTVLLIIIVVAAFLGWRDKRRARKNDPE